MKKIALMLAGVVSALAFSGVASASGWYHPSSNTATGNQTNVQSSSTSQSSSATIENGGNGGGFLSPGLGGIDTVLFPNVQSQNNSVTVQKSNQQNFNRGGRR